MTTPTHPLSSSADTIRRYVLVMSAATVSAIATGVFAAWAGGGDNGVLTAVATALAASAAITLGPVLVRPPLVRMNLWGMVVLGAISARMLAAICGMLVLIEVLGLAKAPVVYGLLTGTLVLMAAEAGAAVWLLNRRPGATDPVTSDESTSRGEVRRIG